jgi:hypothetical protein
LDLSDLNTFNDDVNTAIANHFIRQRVAFLRSDIVTSSRYYTSRRRDTQIETTVFSRTVSSEVENIKQVLKEGVTSSAFVNNMKVRLLNGSSFPLMLFTTAGSSAILYQPIC